MKVMIDRNSGHYFFTENEREALWTGDVDSEVARRWREALQQYEQAQAEMRQLVVNAR